MKVTNLEKTITKPFDNKVVLKKRDTNFELLRIISMIMIICLHFNGNGKLLNANPYFSKVWFLSNITEFACIIAVNIYVLITGYYMVKSKIKLRKIILLELEILFYSIGIYLILVIFNKINFSKKEFINVCFPVISSQYWFLTAYMGLYVLIPFLNKLANSLNKNQYKLLIIILTILLSIIKTINPNNNVFSNSNGYTLTWFLYLYLLAGYMRIHYVKETKKIKLFILYILIVSVQLFLKVFFVKNLYIQNNYISHLLGYDNLFVLIESLVVFLFFKDIKIINKFTNKIILFISPLTLAVYLIHDNNFIRNILWNRVFKTCNIYSCKEVFLNMVIYVPLIFIICCGIEYVRRILFRIISKCKIIKCINRKIDSLEEKLFSLL